MGRAKIFGELLLPSLALAVTASLCLLVAQPAQGSYRALKFRVAEAGAQPDNLLGSPIDAYYGCGFFNSSDPVDAGVPHQPCYGEDGTIEFCCLSGSSQCSCPFATGFDLGCYNFEAKNSLNANTGTECAWFLPKRDASGLRRQLAGCTCPMTQQTCDDAPLSTSSMMGGNVNCQYGANSGFGNCTYNGTTGDFAPGSETYCCPNKASDC